MRVTATELMFDGISLRQPGETFDLDDKIVAADKDYASKNPGSSFPYKVAAKPKKAAEEQAPEGDPIA